MRRALARDRVLAHAQSHSRWRLLCSGDGLTLREALMDRIVRQHAWMLERRSRALQLDEDLGRPSGAPPLAEELRIVLALVALAAVAILLA